MPLVVLLRGINGRREFCGMIEEARASACSRTIREEQRNIPWDCPAKIVTIHSGDTVTLEKLLGLIRRYGTESYIPFGRHTLEEYVKLFEAAEALEVEPYWPELEDHIRQHIRDYKMTAEGLLAVCDTFEPRQRESNVYRV